MFPGSSPAEDPERRTKTHFLVSSYYKPEYGIYRDPTKKVGFEFGGLR